MTGFWKDVYKRQVRMGVCVFRARFKNRRYRVSKGENVWKKQKTGSDVYKRQVVDSVAALVPRAEIEGEMGDSHVGLQARLMSQALRKLAGAISKSNCVAIFINQLREKVGVVYGNPEVTPGGRALKFYSSVRLDVRKKEVLKSGTDIIGSRTKVKVVKNKVAPPFLSLIHI